jgi:hypothetical protein
MTTWQEERSHCARGHAFTADNVRMYRDPRRGREHRVCLECRRMERRRNRGTAGRTLAEWRAVAKGHKQPALPFPVQKWRTPEQARRIGNERARGRLKIEVQRATAFMRALKSKPCTDCKQTFHFAAMDFDHLPQFEKLDTLSNLASAGASDARILEEVAKCELVCANCHRVRTYMRRHQSTGSPVATREKLSTSNGLGGGVTP